MKKTLIILFIVSQLSFLLFSQPVIKFKQKIINFGEIQSGKVIDLKFEFVNDGDTTLIIKNIRTTCGCTVTQIEKREYKPGESGKIPVKFFSQGYNGKIVKTITVITNDKTNQYTRLKITGKVILKDFASIKIFPDRVDFKDIKVEEKYFKKISIQNTGTIDLVILEVTHAPEIMVEFEKKIIKPNEISEINIILNPMQTENLTTFLKIRTNAYRQNISIVRINVE
jgi:hypothetical protein